MDKSLARLVVLTLVTCAALAVTHCRREARPAAAVQSFAVDSQPIQTVEGTASDGSPNFGLIAGSTRLADGTVVIGDYNASELKYFDGAGRLLRSVGREGGGPGEFGMLSGVRPCDGDSLFATDARHGVSVFTSAGAFVREFRLPQFARLAACSPTGVLAVVKSSEEDQVDIGPELRRIRTPVVLADARGNEAHELGTVALYDIHTAGNGWLPRPGTALASFAVGRDRVVVCPNDSGAVGVYSINGKPRRSIPLAVPPRAPSRAYVERFADRFLAAMPVALKGGFRQRFLEIPPAEHLPPCSKVLMDPDDNTWVVLSVPGDSVTTLRIFGPDDRLLGDVTVPVEMDVLEIGSDYLLGSGEDADGEPWVRVYRLRRTAAR